MYRNIEIRTYNISRRFTRKAIAICFGDEIGEIRFSFSVKGYWSGEQITVSFERGRKPNLSYSSGGYERDYDEIERAQNFHAALAEAISVMQAEDAVWETAKQQLASATA